jgi:hypothetical protein
VGAALNSVGNDVEALPDKSVVCIIVRGRTTPAQSFRKGAWHVSIVRGLTISVIRVQLLKGHQYQAPSVCCVLPTVGQDGCARKRTLMWYICDTVGSPWQEGL